MDPKIQTSFIPRKPIVGDQNASKSSINFVSIIVFTIFLTSIALSAGAYVYKYYINNQIVVLKKQFETSKKDFNQNFVDEASRLSQRLSASSDILKNHISASSIFDLLQKNTLQTVSFTGFTYSRDDLGNIKISTTGVAKSFSSVALQSDAFVEQISCIKNPIFSNLTPDAFGNVTFKFEAVLDAGVINYSKNRDGNFCQDTKSIMTASSTNNVN
ncbi:hypothetical protein IT397_01645 [Candidatus Nomurabacteria bacterium]|nr:hypothetical protein [Candidatus Nomurabacteria bacterium]